MTLVYRRSIKLLNGNASSIIFKRTEFAVNFAKHCDQCRNKKNSEIMSEIF